jgi:inorganic triphosphatase YgiF
LNVHQLPESAAVDVSSREDEPAVAARS